MAIVGACEAVDQGMKEMDVEMKKLKEILER
jgi:hypothetical protein